MSGIDLSQLTLWLPALQTAAWLVAALALVAMAMAGFDIAAEIRALGKTLDDAGTSGPLNVNINLMASRATQSLNSAVASKGGTAAPREVARTVSAFARPQVFRRLQGTRVLWVDDIPANNL